MPGTVPDSTHSHAEHFDQQHYAAESQPTKFTADDFTISLWLMPDSKGPRSPNLAQYILNRSIGYHSQRGDIALKISRLSHDLDFCLFGDDGQRSDWIFGWDVPETRMRSPVRFDKWNHVAVTRHGDKYTMWMNGKRVVSERSSANVSDADNTHCLTLGGPPLESGLTESGFYEAYLGDVDDFRIFRRCLSDMELVDLFMSRGDETAMKGEGRVKFGPLAAGPATVEIRRAPGGAQYTFPPGPGLSQPSPSESSAPKPGWPPGITVQITGVGGAEGWWNADGSPMPNPPPPVSGEQPALNEPMHRAFLVRVVNQTSAVCGLICEVAQPAEFNWRVPPGRQAGPGDKVLLDFSAYLPEASFFTTLRIGVSSGPWEDLARNTYDNSGKEERPAKNDAAVLLNARDTSEGLRIGSVDHRTKDELRIVAIAKDGRLIEPKLHVSGHADERSLWATFPDLSLRQIREIKLQHRPYVFVEFHGVATQPSDKSVSPAETEYAKLPYTTRKILAALQSKTKAEFKRVPLTEVVDNLKDHHHIQILLDDKVLAAAKIDTATPVTFSENMTLQSDLDCMLGPIGLADVVTDEVLLITTPEEAKRLVKQGAIDPAARRSPRAAVEAKKIADALRSASAPIEFVETPLIDVVDYLKDAHHIDIVLGLSAEKFENIPDVTMKLHGISLASALHLLLRNAGLTYVVRGEYIFITTPEKAAEIQHSSAARWFSAGPGYVELNKVLSSRGILLSSYNHTKDHYAQMWMESQPGSTIVLLFARDHAENVVPEEFRDSLLPMPWAKIEERLRKGETVEASGNSRERRILLLAAPTVVQLVDLIRKTKLLSVASRAEKGAEKVPGTVSESAPGTVSSPPKAVLTPSGTQTGDLEVAQARFDAANSKAKDETGIR